MTSECVVSAAKQTSVPRDCA